MRLSRSRKLVVIGSALVLIGVAGRATADPAAEPDTAAAPRPSASAAVSPSAVPSALPSAAAPPASPSAAKSPARKTPPATAVPVVNTAKTGPAGSRITTGSKAVALTFDDGPDPVQTPALLKLLAQQRVHATFCVVGKNVRKYPALVRQIVAGGHTLCNHTWDHDLKLGKRPAAKITDDLRRTNDAIRQASPQAKIRYFRAPGGNFTPRLVGVAKKLGMISIHWKVDPRDWEHPKGETAAKHREQLIWRVDEYTRQGAIVLSHDYRQPDTVAAYRTLLPRLRHRFQLIGLP
jgi:peptidoglycan/xylan/chitin deacetylase (PgdA/CDA1 family)